jgi:large subunit ribosomal protein L17
MMRNMVTSLFTHEKIETTAIKAKELVPIAEHMIGLAKRGDLHARRQAEAYMHGHLLIKKLFDQAQDRFTTRMGGYLRITPTRVRRGDAAPMAVVEIVGNEDQKKKKK